MRVLWGKRANLSGNSEIKEKTREGERYAGKRENKERKSEDRKEKEKKQERE